MSKPCYLYRLFHDDELLYVGISISALARLGQHLDDKPWADEINRTTIERHPNREAAAAAEVAAIVTENPRYNIQHNRKPTEVNPRELFFGQVVTAELMPDLCHDGCGGLNSRIYYPWRWCVGIADYTCDNGHHWICGWGHRATGQALENRRCLHVWQEPRYGALFCCDCDKQVTT